ncbi:TATA-binding protein (TBP) [Bonamia ostreae]|uniref:TATA-binding protein (TBP) n=1 Tax=Bonamia ostreae TaxID=126728 RepID=A0ABV2AJ10_9EUKA
MSKKLGAQSTKLVLGIDPRNLYFRNIIATVNVGCYLDTLDISHRLKDAKYNPTRKYAIFRSPDFKTTATAYKRGTIVLNGIKSPQKGEVAAKSIVKFLRNLGYNTNWDRNLQLRCYLCSYDLGSRLLIDENTFADQNPHLVMQKGAEKVRAMVIRSIMPKVSLMIYLSGKILIWGKSPEVITKAINMHLGPLIEMREDV